MSINTAPSTMEKSPPVLERAEERDGEGVFTLDASFT
jgi:hypothetical protein